MIRLVVPVATTAFVLVAALALGAPQAAGAVIAAIGLAVTVVVVVIGRKNSPVDEDDNL